MSAVVADIKNICNSEAMMYVVIASVLSAIVLSLTMDSFLIPLFFLLSIGMSIIYNLGTNFMSGEISFITQALAAVLQLAVTMDYSIFLWHSYQENQKRFCGDKNVRWRMRFPIRFRQLWAVRSQRWQGFWRCVL